MPSHFADSWCKSVVSETSRRYADLEARLRQGGLIVLEVDIGEVVDVETLSAEEVLPATHEAVARALAEMPGPRDLSRVAVIVHTTRENAELLVAEARTFSGARLVGACAYLEGGCRILGVNGESMEIDWLWDEGVDQTEWRAIYEWLVGLA